MRNMIFYYQGNQILVPVWILGDLDGKGDPTLNIADLKLSQGTTGGTIICNRGEAPASVPADGYQINTSNTPIYPLPGSTYYLSFASGTYGTATYHDYRASGGNYVTINNLNALDQRANKVFLAIGTVDGVSHLGYAIVKDYDDYAWCFFYDPSSTSSLDHIYDIVESSPEPGDKGFRPIGNRTRFVAGGGGISGQRPGYNTSHLTQPGEPDETKASIIGAGFINVYMIDDQNTAVLERLGEALFSSTWDNWVTNIFRNPMDSLISLQIFPVKPYSGTSEPIKMLNHSAKMQDLDVDASAPKISKQFRQFDFGTLSIAEMWESFLDYDATSFQLYLPFIGMVDIPVGEVMDGSINVKYTVDFLTGMCVANVLCTKTINVSDGGAAYTQEAQHSYMGNCAVQVPLTSVSYGNIVGALAQAASVGLTTGLAGAAGSLAMSALNGSFKPTVETKGTIGANAGFCSVLYPYITITRPITAEPDSYQQVMGYPSYIESTLGACEDLCVCDDIDLSGIVGATDSEMQRIRQLCKEGVYV